MIYYLVTKVRIKSKYDQVRQSTTKYDQLTKIGRNLQEMTRIVEKIDKNNAVTALPFRQCKL